MKKPAYICTRKTRLNYKKMKNAVEKALKECYNDYKKKECSGWYAIQQQAQKAYDDAIGKALDLGEKIRRAEINIRDRGDEIWIPGQPGHEQNGWNMSIWGMKSYRKLFEKESAYLEEAGEQMGIVDEYEFMMEEDYEESGQMEEDKYNLIQAATQNNG